jgi:hypothetical protein
MYAVVNAGGSAAVDQYGPDGTLRWTTETDPAPGHDNRGIALAAAPDGSIVVAVPGRIIRLDRSGKVLSTADSTDVAFDCVGFDPSGAAVVSGIAQELESPAYDRGFVAKLAPDGIDAWRVPVLWPDAAGSSDAVFSTTGHGTVLSGWYTSQVTVGGLTVVAPVVDAVPWTDCNYLAMVSDDGTVAWARDITDFGIGAPTGGFDEPQRSIAFDDQGNILVAFSDGRVSLGAFDGTGRRTWTRRFAFPEAPNNALAAPVPGSTDLVVTGTTAVHECIDGCDPCANHAHPFLFRVTRAGDLTSGFEGHI